MSQDLLFQFFDDHPIQENRSLEGHYKNSIEKCINSCRWTEKLPKISVFQKVIQKVGGSEQKRNQVPHHARLALSVVSCCLNGQFQLSSKNQGSVVLQIFECLVVIEDFQLGQPLPHKKSTTNHFVNQCVLFRVIGGTDDIPKLSQVY